MVKISQNPEIFDLENRVHYQRYKINNE